MGRISYSPCGLTEVRSVDRFRFAYFGEYYETHQIPYSVLPLDELISRLDLSGTCRGRCSAAQAMITDGMDLAVKPGDDFNALC